MASQHSSWSEVNIDDLPLRFSMAESVVPEFVLDHDDSDVLKELVQNEYDAEGDHVLLAFGSDSLVVTGNGKGMDSGGWRRLSVMLGTGQVAGLARDVKAKINGIGSKNFGLRSLFLYGNLIRVRSHGKETFLHVSRGTLPDPRPDLSSRGRSGVEIFVPYRSVRQHRLEPFGIDREERTLESYSANMSEMLIKLAQPGARKSLTSVTVSSERCSRVLRWNQTVHRVPCKRKGVVALGRVIKRQDTSVMDGERTRQVEQVREIEFQKNYSVPAEHWRVSVPGYFKVAGGRIRIAVSVRMRGKSVDFSAPGILFYPLGAPDDYTGNAVSISAPFEMDTDRSQIIGSENSPWNAWLLQEAADLTLDLLVSDWFDRFGADAYLALEEQFVSTPEYLGRVQKGLKENSCWPTRLSSRGRPQFTTLENIAVPESPDLAEFIPPERSLHERLSTTRVQSMALGLGADGFSIGSLVHLRCAALPPSKQTGDTDGEEVPDWKRRLTQVTGEADDDGVRTIKNPSCRELATVLGDHEADLHYVNFPEPLRSEERQKRIAETLDLRYRSVSKDNRLDLWSTPTTLTAAGTLEAPGAPLYVVDPEIAHACPVAPSRQLHTSLGATRMISRLCKPFDPSMWALDVARLAADGAAREEQRRALYQYILSSHSRLNARTKSLLRNVPVLLDHNGAWVAPNSIVASRRGITARLANVLHFPHRDYARDSSIARAFRFRTTADGNDIINYALTVPDHPDRADGFEETLERAGKLLTKRVLKKLREIRFLMSSSGDLGDPTNLYIRSNLTETCLGEEGPFVAGRRSALYRRLGCQTVPRSEDIIARLEQLREAESAPEQPDTIYPALVSALQAEGAPTSKHHSEAILWNGSSYSAPEDALLGSGHERLFFEAVPHIRAPQKTLSALEQLGAFRRPRPHHWVELLRWLARKYLPSDAPISDQEQRAVLEAYRGLYDRPDLLPQNARCLLDLQARLHFLSDARSCRFLLNDDPRMADEVERQAPGISFAQPGDERVLRFYEAAGVQRLTEARELTGSLLGEPREPPRWFKVKPVLEKLQSPEFTSAVQAVATSELYKHEDGRARPKMALRALERLESISFADETRLEYQLAGTAVSAPTNYLFKDRQLVLACPRHKSALAGFIAEAVASLLVSDEMLQRRLVDAVYRLYDCTTPREIEAYLRGRGIPWRHTRPAAERDQKYDEDDGDDLASAAEETADELSERLKDQLVKDSRGGQESDRTPSEKEPRAGEASTKAAESLALPPIESVTPRQIDTSDEWRPGERAGGRSGGTGGWSPPSRAQQERDTQVGRRGEELIYGLEVDRVRKLGYPETEVEWTSDKNAGADHDIRSVDTDGQPLWIEVKSTTGRHGRFEWSENEFRKAFVERERYVLVRVYEAHTETPSWKSFRDPISRFLDNTVRLDVASLSGEVESLVG